MREFHHLKGVLFQYDRWHSNWIWLPLRCVRPRPPAHLYYPIRHTAEGQPEPEEDEEEAARPPPGICGRQGCMLPNNHGGLCQVCEEGCEEAWRGGVARRRGKALKRLRASDGTRWTLMASDGL